MEKGSAGRERGKERWFLRDASCREPWHTGFRDATRSGWLQKSGRPAEETLSAKRPKPASSKDGNWLLFQGKARRRGDRPGLVGLCFGASSLPSRASSLRRPLLGTPQAHLETEVLKFHQRNLSSKLEVCCSFLLHTRGDEEAAVHCAPLNRRQTLLPAPGLYPCWPRRERWDRAPRSPPPIPGGKEATGDRGALGRSGVYLLQFLGASLQCKKPNEQKTIGIIIIIFFKTLSTTFSHFFIFYILTKLFLNKYKII